jgi:hypothetical protein
MDGALRFLSAPMKDFVIIRVPLWRERCALGQTSSTRRERGSIEWVPCPDQVDKEMRDQYSFLFAATAFFGSDACGALSQLNPDAE